MSSYHLSKLDLLPQEVCQFCQTRFSEQDRQFVLQDQPTVWLVECPKCGLGTGEQLPKAESLSKLYDPEHYQASLTNSTRISQKLASKIVRGLNKSSLVSAQKEKEIISILDFGGGNGVLCHQVRQQLVLLGVPESQISCSVVDVYNSVGFDDIAFINIDDFDQSDERYRIVIASAVLEHLPEANHYLIKLLGAVESLGVFYARTPYEVPLAKLPLNFKTSWPIHVHDMGPDFWEYVINNRASDFDVVLSNTSTLESNFKDKALRTSLAFLLKLPSYVETALFKKLIPYRGVIWKYIGGWEVVLRRR